MRVDRIREEMDRQGLSQSELARIIGTTQGTVQQILSGSTKRSRFLPEIARALGVSVPYLLGESDDGTSTTVPALRNNSVRPDACQTCRFWDVYDETSSFYDNIEAKAIGDCRRRAPRISDELLRRNMPAPGADQFEGLANNLYVPSAFPVTARENWCGEFERRVS